MDILPVWITGCNLSSCPEMLSVLVGRELGNVYLVTQDLYHTEIPPKQGNSWLPWLGSSSFSLHCQSYTERVGPGSRAGLGFVLVGGYSGP